MECGWEVAGPPAPGDRANWPVPTSPAPESPAERWTMLRRYLRRTPRGALAIILVVVAAGQAKAVMTLTAQGTAAGFQLTTFADQFPNTGGGGVGPVGISFTTSGGVMVSSY